MLVAFTFNAVNVTAASFHVWLIVTGVLVAMLPTDNKLFRLTFFEIAPAVSHTNTQSASATKVFSVNCERLRLALVLNVND